MYARFQAFHQAKQHAAVVRGTIDARAEHVLGFSGIAGTQQGRA